MTRLAVLVPALVFGLASTAYSQSSYRDYLELQLSAVGQAIAGSGYREEAAAIFYPEFWVSLESTTSLGLEVILQLGARYRIVTDFLDWEGDDCAKSLVDSSDNTLFTGVWSENRSANVLDFTAPASGTHILVVNCPDGVVGFFYDVERMSPAGYFQSDPGALPTDMIVGFLRSGATVGLDLDLDLGGEYLIAGVCDQDCSDLDLELTDEQGAILFTDEMDDDEPVLQFTSPADGLHTIWVTMYACSVEPCSFAYKAYRR
ncbi:MAG TPA: hypothetical protein VEY33_12765 [Gemmatimonadota bacterium]|nr:hypothetical protein [Gemmatimonadota bacterium]